jgi:hypothetical protein
VFSAASQVECRRLRLMHRPAGKVIPNYHGESTSRATNSQYNTREGAVMKRSQLAIKTMGKKTFISGTRKAGQRWSVISITKAVASELTRKFPELSVRAVVPE